MTHQALVIGLGPLGRRVVHDLERRSLPVVGASRTRPEGFAGAWRQLDAAGPQDVRAAAEDCDIVLLCAAPPLTRWTKDFERLVGGVLEGLHGSGKTLVLASNLYPYGPQQGTYTESSPELAAGPKGLLRKRLDRQVLDAHGARGLSTAVVRASSFYGPEVATSMAGRTELDLLRAGKPVPALGSVDQPHSMTYIDDFARAMVSVALERSAWGQIWHAPPQEAITHRELLTAFGTELGATPKFRIASPLVVSVMGLFNPLMRELKETLYTYTGPHLVDGSKYCKAFGDEPTPLDEAVRLTLQSAPAAALPQQ